MPDSPEAHGSTPVTRPGGTGAPQVRLLGTGAPDGWPAPGCGCASCRWAASASGLARAPTAVLVGCVLLLADAAALPVAAAEGSRAGAQTLLLPTRSGAVEPPPWSPSDPVTHVRPGDRLRRDGWDIRVLPGATPAAVGYDVGRDGWRLLWGGGSHEPRGLPAVPGGYDVVLLDERWGDAADLPDAEGHLDLAGFALTLADLRRSGRVTDRTQVVAVGLGHGNPRGPELDRRLAQLGAVALPDGAVVPPAGPPPGPRRVLVTGGARSGKSAEAERRLGARSAVTYVATAPPRPGDDEWDARVAVHRARRPSGWTTVETGDVAGHLRGATGPVLVDCLSLWLSAAMDDSGVWEGRAGADAALAHRVDDLVAAWRAARLDVVAVTAEVGAGIVPDHRSGRRFRDELGSLNARIAREADETWLVVAGIATRLA